MRMLILLIFTVLIAGFSCAPQPESHHIEYEVDGNADDIAYIQYYSEKFSSDYEFDREVTLPWYYSFDAPSGKYLKFVVHTESVNVSITAKIIIDGNVSQMQEVYLDYPDAFVTVDSWVP